MIKAIIIDDEPNCIDSLKIDLQKNCKNIDVCETCTSAKEAIPAISKFKPMLIFLDVEMPGINGFEMLEMLEPIDFYIIFTTAYDQFAARAFRISAVDYLLKPIDPGDLKVAVQKAEEKILATASPVNIQNLLYNIKQPVHQQRIALPNRDGYEFTEVNTILYCTAEGAYTKIYFNNKHSVLISRILGDIEELLPSELFLRIHHSTIVNINSVTQYVRSDGGYVVMSNNEKLMVSKARKDMLLARLGLK